MPTVTAATTVALFVLLTALSLNVSRLRIRHRVSFGHGEHKNLEVAVRAHGNTLEQSTLFLLLLLLAELHWPQATWLAGIGLAFVLTRLLHSAAIFGRRLRLRQWAHVSSLLLQMALVPTLVQAVMR